MLLARKCPWRSLDGSTLVQAQAPASRDWVWQWVLPATRIHVEREIGERRRLCRRRVIVSQVNRQICTALGGSCNTRLPPFTLERRLGLDGTSYEVSFGCAFVTSQFRWWESPPNGWQPPQQFVDDVRALVDAAVDGTGQPAAERQYR